MDYVRYLRSMVGTKPVIIVSAGVVIFDASGRLLMQRRTDDGTWGLIGGFMELGKTVETAARREVFEETGLTVGALTLFEVFSSRELVSFPNGDRTQVVTVSYLTEEVRETLRPDIEGLELRYFALHALPEPLFAPNTLSSRQFGRSTPLQPSAGVKFYLCERVKNARVSDMAARI